MKKDNNKKQKYLTLIAIITLVALISGATYAYFAVGTVNNFGTSTINATADNIGQVILTSPTNSIHLSVSAIEMMDINQGTLYYATDESGVNNVPVDDDESNMYMQSVIANTKTIATLTLTGDSSNTDYKCTFNLNMNVSGTMKDVFQGSTNGWDGEFYLYNQNDFTAGLTSYMQSNDMSGIMNSILYSGMPISGTYPITVYLNGSSVPTVSLGIAMFVENSDYNQTYLAGTTFSDSITASNLSCAAVNLSETHASAPGTMLEGENNLSSELLGGLYRYQGNANNNYICFGTDNTSTCTNNASTYMYRIIGITSDNKLKLIKDSGLNDEMRWNNNYTNNVVWPNSDLYTAINGSAFLTNTTYVPNSTWEGKIATTTWKYGDLRGNGYSGDIMYSLENSFATTTNAKIGLMYLHDYIYGINWLGAYDVINSTYEWTMSRFGLSARRGGYAAWSVNSDGMLDWFDVSYADAVRPVFYLTSGITLTGSGTTSSPYTIS